MNNNGSKELRRQAYEKALRVVAACARPEGMIASARSHGYPQVWARDSMITLLGAVLADNPDFDRSLRSSFRLLAENQSPLGLIPNNVHIKTLKPSFQAYADAGLWFIIGAANFFEKTGNSAFRKKIYPRVKKALAWSSQSVPSTGPA